MDYLAYLGTLGFFLVGCIGAVLYSRYRSQPTFVIPAIGFAFLHSALLLLPGIALDSITDPVFSRTSVLLETALLLLLGAMFAGLATKERQTLAALGVCTFFGILLIASAGSFFHALWAIAALLCAILCARNAILAAGHVRLKWAALAIAFLMESAPNDPKVIVEGFFSTQLYGNFISPTLILNSISSAFWCFGLWFWYRVETWERLTLRPSPSDPTFSSSRSIVIVATGLLILLLGFPTLGFLSRYLEAYRRDQLVLQARIAASPIGQLPPPTVPITAESKDNPEYQQWKALLSLIARTGVYEFAYLIVEKDGMPVFLADSAEPGSEDESPIGEVWHSAPEEIIRILVETNSQSEPEPAVVGPYKDKWGVWITALVPVPNWHVEGKPVWLAVDRTAGVWQTADLRLRQAGMIAITLLLGILLFSFTLHRMNVEARWRLSQSHTRLSLSLQGGNLIAWEYDPVQDRLQMQGEVERLGLSDVVPVMQLEQFMSLLPQNSANILREHWPRLFSREHGEIRLEFPLHPDGKRPRWACLIGKVLARRGDSTPVLIAGTLQDISSQKEMEQRLREEKEAADAANRAKSTFLATMSHEIRTPLNAIIGMSSLLCRQDLPPKARDFAHTILDAGESLLDLINDILDYSKIEAGKIELEHLPFSLSNLLRELESIFRNQAESKGLKFSITMRHPVPEKVIGDLARLRQILMNLIGNAVKFTSEGSVQVQVEFPSKDRGRFCVIDTGIGMSPEEVAQLFQPFKQADSSITRRFGGSGLGLVISKRLAELMKGTISVRSRKGHGSEFTVEVELPAAPDTETITKEAARKITVEKVEVREEPLRVLVAEDNPTNQKVIQAMFNNLHQPVNVVENGELAVAESATTAYDLILLDVQMPVLDGLQAARLIREAERETGHRALVVALTANAFKEDREQCLAAGMDEYYAKPIKLDQIRSLLLRARDAKKHSAAMTP